MTVAPKDAETIARELAPRIREGAAERDRERNYPDEEMALLKKSGLLGLFVPKEYGGLDVDCETAVRVLAILAEADPNVAQNTQPHHSGMEFLKFGGTELLKEYYLRRVAEQGILVTNAVVEISKKHILEYNARLRPDGENFYLNGVKFYATGSRWADAFFGPAIVEGTDEARLAFFGANEPGVIVQDDWDGMGQRTTASGTVEFHDVFVPGDFCIPAEPFNAPNSYLGPHAQSMLAAIYLGMARGALADTVDYLQTQARPWFETGLETATEDPYIMHHIGEMQVAVDGAGLLLNHAAKVLDRARTTLEVHDKNAASIAVAEAKAATTEAALKVTSELFQVCGARSTRSSSNLDRHWRNARTLTLHDPVDYKYRTVGDYVLNGTPPTVSGWT